MLVPCTKVWTTLVYVYFNVIDVILCIVRVGLIVQHQLLLLFIIIISGSNRTIYNGENELMHTTDLLL